MRVAAGVGEQVAEQTVGEPWRRVAESLNVAIQFFEGDFNS